MDKSILYALGVEQYRQFIDNYEHSLRKGEAEFIHHFRVAVKRLISLREYMVTCSNPLAVDLFDTFISAIHPVYKISGKVRNLQVAIITVSDNVNQPPSSDFISYIMDKLRRRKEKYIFVAQSAHIPAVAEFENEFTLITQDYYNGNLEKFTQHIVRNKELAVQLIKGAEPGKEWHEARRWLKRNYLLLQMTGVGSEMNPEDADIIYYRNIEQLIGQWHDLFFLDKQIRKYEELHPAQLVGGDLFKKEIANTMRALEHDIRNSI